MLDRLYILVEMLAMTVCLHQLYGKKYTFEYKTIVLLAVDMLLVQGINDNYLPQLSIVIIYPIICGYSIWKFKSTLKAGIINTIICVVISGFLQMLSVSCIGRLSNIGVSEEVIFILGNSIMLIAFIALAKTHLLFRISKYFQKSDVILYLVLIGGGIGIVVSAIALKMNEGMYQGQYLYLCVIIVILFFMTASWQRYKMKALENEMELRAYKLYEQSYKNLITEIRVKQHDIKNHINAIYMQHMTSDTYDELVERQKKYCEDVVHENQFTDLLNVGDSMAIGFLYSKLNEASECGIEVDYKVQPIDLNEYIPISKLVTILGNLMDNAIEALEDNDTKKLFVSLIEENSVLNIEVRNTNKVIEWKQVQLMFRKGYSTKGNARGLGLYSVKKIGKEYDFDVVFSNKNISGTNWVSFEIKMNKRLL